MSHLPPRPDYPDYPSRYPSDRHYNSRSAPMAPDHAYTRDRDSYPPRSPPRAKRPSRRDDSYVPGREPYLPHSYDRPREDDRYRDSYREWDRREREHPPPTDWRYRGEPDRSDWPPRDDERRRTYDRREDSRAWTRRGDEDRPYARRDRPPSPERKWIPRPSKSPPRRMVPVGQSKAQDTSPLPRSPASPRKELRSPTRSRHARSPSPIRRSSRSRSPVIKKLDSRSNTSAYSPRKAGISRRRYDDDRSRWRGRRSPSRSRSPYMRRRGDSRRRSPSPYEWRRDRRARSREPRQWSPPAKRQRSKTVSRSPPSSSISRSRSRSANSAKRKPHRLRRSPLRSPSPIRIADHLGRPIGDIDAEEKTVPPSLPNKQEPPSPLQIERAGSPSILQRDQHHSPSRQPSPTLKSKPPKERSPSVSRQTSLQPANQERSSPAPAREESTYQPPARKRRTSRSPPVQPRNYVKTPTTSMSPHIPSPFSTLPAKPTSLSTSPTSVEPPAEQPPNFLPVIPKYVPPNNSNDWSAAFENELTIIRGHRTRLENEYSKISRETRRAIHELELAGIDLRVAQKRRVIANAQLEKAKIGALGIDYVPVGSWPT